MGGRGHSGQIKALSPCFRSGRPELRPELRDTDGNQADHSVGPGGLLEQVDVGPVDLAGGAGHTDLARSAAGEVAFVPAGLDFGGLTPGGGLGQLGEQEPPVAGEAAAGWPAG